MKILAINPGSTSTKIAVYEDETPLLVRNIRHTVEELAVFPEVTDQFEFRKSLVLTELEKEGYCEECQCHLPLVCRSLWFDRGL